MRILLTSPFAHPYVWRGAEHYLHELAAWLAGRGHAVTIVTTTPDESRVVVDGGVVISYCRRGRSFGRGRLRVDELLRAVPSVARGIRGLEADVIQCHHYVDAVALRLGRPRAAAPYVLWLPGVPRRSSLGGRPMHRAAFRAAAGGASRILALSRFSAAALQDEFGLIAEVMPPGLNVSLYDGPKLPSTAPMILCTAAADDPRKRVDLLVRAFPEVLRQRPMARLVLAPPRPETVLSALDTLDARVREHVEVRTVRGASSLAPLYREATATVLPSVDEAFGLVLVESLAAGTPVVGSDHGAIPEIVESADVGQLFRADDRADLVRAMLAVLELAGDPRTPDRCRAAAKRWSWDEIGPRMEHLYEAVAAASDRRTD